MGFIMDIALLMKTSLLFWLSSKDLLMSEEMKASLLASIKLAPSFCCKFGSYYFMFIIRKILSD